MNSIKLTNGSDSFTWDNSITGSVLQDFEGFEYSEVRDVIESIPGREGALYINALFGRRRLSWSGEYLGDDEDQVFTLRRNASKVLQPGSLKTLEFTTYDSLDLQAEVEVVGYTAPYKKAVNRYKVECVAPDPRFYSQTLQTSNTSETTSQGGLSIPTAIPASFSDTGGSGPVIVNNGGTVASPPTLTITGPGTNFTIQNITTGKTMKLNTTLSSGETVVFDVVDRTVTKGSNQNLYGSFSGSWWELEPGDNEINFQASSGSDSDTNLKIEFRDAYIGV